MPRNLELEDCLVPLHRGVRVEALERNRQVSLKRRPELVAAICFAAKRCGWGPMAAALNKV